MMDKLKAQASQFAERAQEAGKVGQAKLEALQARRKADNLCEELGRLTYRAKVGGGAAGDDRKVADLVEQLKQYEAEYGSLDEPATAVDGDSTSGV